MDGPQWRLYAQDYKPIDEPADTPEDQKIKGFTLLKGHHSMCDGVSIMCMVLSMTADYSRDYFIKSEDAKWYEALYVRLSSLFQLPKIFVDTIWSTGDDNFITRQRAEKSLCGEVNVQTTKFIDLRLLKGLSKKIKVTINDIVNCALSVSLEQIFRENKDDSTEIKMVIPASIRFAFYPTKEDVVLENKFAAIPVTLPLVKDMESAAPKIK